MFSYTSSELIIAAAGHTECVCVCVVKGIELTFLYILSCERASPIGKHFWFMDYSLVVNMRAGVAGINPIPYCVRTIS